MNKTLLIRNAAMAGIFIGIAGWVNLAIGGIAGAIIFAFGLMSVVLYGTPLFTGKAGFVETKTDIINLLYIILGNLFGVILVGALSNLSPLPINETAEQIISAKLLMPVWTEGLLAIGCGLIMTDAVHNARNKNQWLPLLYGVPAFIICGFPHSIADAFYICALPVSYIVENFFAILTFWLSILVGNFLGCNIHRIFGIKLNS